MILEVFHIQTTILFHRCLDAIEVFLPIAIGSTPIVWRNSKHVVEFAFEVAVVRREVEAARTNKHFACLLVRNGLAHYDKCWPLGEIAFE